ncbi:putative mitochondrial protein [Apostasia shenzhenica]|uniref:Putative mitochondrial protein n=1 Tax=Apostasia shenzhenica TaxID=1088818 RepID=A0A2I0A3N9_9ASPA|nr:putative mitochondrial protein [Apostasia shenzhenica]
MGTIKRKAICILIDSGSTHNFLDPSILSLIECEVEPIPLQHVTIANGNKISLTKKVRNFQWLMQGVRFTTDAFLMPLESYHMVLEIQWLSELGVVNWNFKNLKMEFKVNDKQIILYGTRTPFLKMVNEKQLDKAMQNSPAAFYICFHSSILAASNSASSTPDLFHALNSTQQGELQSLLDNYLEVFSEPKGLPPHRAFDHRIILKEGTDPINVKPYRYPALQKSAIEKLIAEMKDAGIIRDSASPFSSPIVLIKKKDGSWRLCVDYKELN